MQLAVNQGAGGPQSEAIATWMVEATVQWFAENKDLETYEVEDFLADVVHQEFNVLVEDGSVAEISQMICEFYKLSMAGNHCEFRNRLQKIPQKCDLNQCKVESDEQTIENADDNVMEVDSEQIKTNG